ncbi:hypothetical protein SAMN06298216_1902 [Spirosomataceae bacterium TFI 002]|nr:hypothetical protein SAMN06298216_1902 [Spirosomataceae bacterium TFI 002]
MLSQFFRSSRQKIYSYISNNYKFILIIFALFLIFQIVEFGQGERISKRLQDCSYVSVLTPIRMPDTHSVFFNYEYQGKKNKGYTIVGAEDVGYLYTKTEILHSRFFVRISCFNPKMFSVVWDIKVPDSLTFVPKNGWDKIPYGLDKTVDISK